MDGNFEDFRSRKNDELHLDGKPQPRSHGGTINCKGGSNSGPLRAQTRQQVGVLRKVSQEPAEEVSDPGHLLSHLAQLHHHELQQLRCPPLGLGIIRDSRLETDVDCHRQKEQQIPISRRGAYEHNPSAAHPSSPTQQRRWILIRVFTEKQRISDIKMSTHKNYQIFPRKSTPETRHRTQ